MQWMQEAQACVSHELRVPCSPLCCSDMRWVFVRGGEQPTVVARGPVLRNANPNEPTGVHLMRSRSPS